MALKHKICTQESKLRTSVVGFDIIWLSLNGRYECRLIAAPAGHQVSAILDEKKTIRRREC